MRSEAQLIAQEHHRLSILNRNWGDNRFGYYTPTKLCDQCSLTSEAWKTLPAEDQADIEEFFVNAHADYLRVMLDTNDNRRQIEAIAKGMTQATDRFIADLATVYQAPDTEHRREQERTLTRTFDRDFLSGVDGGRTSRYLNRMGDLKLVICQYVKERAANGEPSDQDESDLVRYTLRDLMKSTGQDTLRGLIQALLDELIQTAGENFLRDHYKEYSPGHDALHYLERRRAQNGAFSRPRFVEAHRPETAYFDEQSIREELYVALIGPGREDWIVYQTEWNNFARLSFENKLRRFEQHMVQHLSKNVRERSTLDPMTHDDAIHLIHSVLNGLTMKTRPAHYVELARKLFPKTKMEVRDKGRQMLYVQEILEVIRLQPPNEAVESNQDNTPAHGEW